jgi:membrane associated rhomboid family serine protease
VRRGEVWRLVTKPFIHASFESYINNALSIMLGGALSWALIGWRSIPVFLVANAFAAAVVMRFGSIHFDSFVGVSGGLFALCGLVITAGLARKGLFPTGFTRLCALIALTSLAGSALLSTAGGALAHWTGAFVGSCIGLLSIRRKDKRVRPNFAS